MADVSTQQLRKEIAGILKGADLGTITAKKVRQQLEEKLKTDLLDRKKEVDDLVMAYLDEKQDGKELSEDNEEEEEDEDEEDEEDDKPKKTTKRTAAAKKGSSEESEDESEGKGSDEDYNPSAKKAKGGAGGKKGAGVAGGGGRKKRGSESDDSDEDWNKSRRTGGGAGGGGGGGGGGAAPPKKPPAQAGGGAPGGKRETGYTRTCKLSPELADVVGTEYMARHEVVKKVWSIIKERNLYDPKNKQFAICDDQLLKVFGVKRFRTFGMMKYLKNHFVD